MAKKWYKSKIIIKIWNRIFVKKYSNSPKESSELAHWVGQALQKKDNDHFEYFYTKEFGKSIEFYNNKKIMKLA
jgi:hypothetical protein